MTPGWQDRASAGNLAILALVKPQVSDRRDLVCIESDNLAGAGGRHRGAVPVAGAWGVGVSTGWLWVCRGMGARGRGPACCTPGGECGRSPLPRGAPLPPPPPDRTVMRLKNPVRVEEPI